MVEFIRYYLFLTITLLGCLAPWFTPRVFLVRPKAMQTNYATPDLDLFEIENQSVGAASVDLNSRLQMEVVQNAC